VKDVAAVALRPAASVTVIVEVHVMGAVSAAVSMVLPGPTMTVAGLLLALALCPPAGAQATAHACVQGVKLQLVVALSVTVVLPTTVAWTASGDATGLVAVGGGMGLQGRGGCKEGARRVAAGCMCSR
jgi:hypothetical protein